MRIKDIRLGMIFENNRISKGKTKYLVITKEAGFMDLYPTVFECRLSKNNVDWSDEPYTVSMENLNRNFTLIHINTGIEIVVPHIYNRLEMVD